MIYQSKAGVKCPLTSLLRSNHYKTFSENIIFIFNDPQDIVLTQTYVQFMRWVLSIDIDEFFYKNDVQVIFDVILREIELVDETNVCNFD